ncbi:hypothetical protein [Sphingomonas azotifigens]|nr:hypothetical protein [Sphingomonas azotifigens]
MRLDRSEARDTGFGVRTAAGIALIAFVTAMLLVLWKLRMGG